MRAERQMEQRIVNVERRVDRIEQILPTLATRGHVSDAIVASEERMRAHVSDSIAASEDRMRAHVSDSIAASEERMRAHVSDSIAASEERTRAHFDVVAESLRHQVRLVAESVAVLSERMR